MTEAAGRRRRARRKFHRATLGAKWEALVEGLMGS